MSATEREHVMPPRPLIPWTMALCAGMCMSCVLVLNIAADALLRERAPAVGPLWAIPVAAAVFVVLAQSCARLAPWKRWLYAASVGLVAGAVVSAWWAVDVLSASKALDGRAASSLEFVVQGDPSINDDVYSYTARHARTVRTWQRFAYRVIVSSRSGRTCVLSVAFHVLRTMRMDDRARSEARCARLKPFGFCPSMRALRGRCFGCEMGCLCPLRLRPNRRVRS